MAVTEERRHDLYTHFEEAMGHERATTLMELLPPVGWGDVATKQDLTAVDSSLRKEITAVDSSLRAEIRQGFAHMEAMTERRFAHMGVMNEQGLAHMGVMTEQGFAHIRETVATKVDVAEVRTEIANFRAEVHKAMRTHTIALIMAMFVLAGVVSR